MIFIHMLSYSRVCLGPQVGVRLRGGAFPTLRFHYFHGRKRKNGLVLPGYRSNPNVVKYYERPSSIEDDEDFIEDFDGYGSDDFLLEELNNLNDENAKSAKKASSRMSLSALSGPSSPERELKHGKKNANVLKMTGKGSDRNGTSRFNSSVQRPSSLRLSRKEWEKRALEIIQEQKLRNIAMKKRKTEQKVMLKSPKSENVKPLTRRSVSRSNAMETKKAELKIVLKSLKSKDDMITGRSMTRRDASEMLNEEVKAGKIEDTKYQQVRKRLGCEVKHEPLIQYLSNLGFKEAHLVRIYDRHKSALHAKVAAVQKRLDFLISVGVKAEDLVKIITRQPQILEYNINDNIKPRIEFLQGLGVPASRLGRMITVAPYLLSYSVELSLKPKVRFLTQEVGIERKNLGKVVVLSPQILTQPKEESKSRLNFLSNELGASKGSLMKMVKKHPQLLHYSIQDGIQPRIEFLRSIGMGNADIVKVLTSLTQILSLSVEKSLRPKYLYLINELNNEVQSLTANPAYFSLSLEQRITPRHRFLTFLKKVPSGPFPLTALLVTDDSFCGQWANSTLEEYEAFRKELLLGKLKRQLLQKYGSCNQQSP